MPSCHDNACIADTQHVQTLEPMCMFQLKNFSSRERTGKNSEPPDRAWNLSRLLEEWVTGPRGVLMQSNSNGEKSVLPLGISLYTNRRAGTYFGFSEHCLQRAVEPFNQTIRQDVVRR